MKQLKRKIMLKELENFDDEFLQEVLKGLSSVSGKNIDVSEFKSKVIEKYKRGWAEHDDELEDIDFDAEIMEEIYDIYLYGKMKFLLPKVIEKARRMERLINEDKDM